MKILYFLLFLAVCAGVFWFLNRMIHRLAYSREQRYLHCRIIPVVFLALLIGANVYTIAGPLQILDKIINAPVLAYFFNLILPNRAYQLVYMMLVLLGLNLAAMLLVISCVSVMRLVFIGRDSFLSLQDAPLLDKILHLPWLVAGMFYDSSTGEVRLTHRGFVMGIWVKGFKRTFAVLWAVQMLVLSFSILWGSEQLNNFLLTVTKSWHLLPMAGFLILEQIQFFLEGSFEENAGTFESGDVVESQHNPMLPLLKAYRRTFSGSDALLCDDLNESISSYSGGLASNDLGNQLVQNCSQRDVLKVLWNQLQACDVRQSEQYQNALADLLNGSCVNICDLCEGEFLIYLCAYLNYQMAQGRTVLFLCKDSQRSAELCDAVNREMHRLNNLYSIWNICTLEGVQANGRMSALVCSVDEFLDHHIPQRCQDFVDDLFCVILTDSMDLFAGSSIRQDRLFGILRGIESLKQYVAFSSINNDALRTAMEHAIKQEVHPFLNDCAKLPNSGVMVWREESANPLQRQLGVGSRMSPYMGAAIPLALVALKFDFPMVVLVPDSQRGDNAFFDVLTMSAGEAMNYLAVQRINLASVISRNINDALRQRDLSVTVVYDTDFNFLNALNRWRKYGGTKGFLLHIISPPYALREYFAANYKDHRLYIRNNEFDALISGRQTTKVSRMEALLVSLCGNGMTDIELMEKVKEYCWDYQSVDQLLEDCLKVVLTREEIHSVYECFRFKEEKRFRDDLSASETYTRISLIDDTILERLHSRTRYAALISRDNQGQSLPVLSGNLCNYYLLEQIVPVGGYFYQIHSINNGNLYGRQLLPQELPEYHQISSFTFRNLQSQDHGQEAGPMELKLYTADAIREIFGYWSCSGGNTFASSGAYLTRLAEPIRSEMAGVSVLEVRIRRNAFGNRATEAIRLLAYLLKDFSKTLFPHSYQNLFAVTEAGDPQCLDRVLEQGSKAGLEDIVCSLIPAVTNPPECSDEFIRIFLVEFSCIEFGMVQMLYSRFRSVLLMVREYLSWYLEKNAPAPTPTEAAEDGSENTSDQSDGQKPEPAASGRPGYLHFGADEIPKAIDLAELLQLCNTLVEDDIDNAPAPVAVNLNEDLTTCDFCGRETMYPFAFSDGRKMCADCKDHQLTQQDEIRIMFHDTVQYLKKSYQITLPDNLNVRFQSADAIRRAAGSVVGGRILGFYNAGNRHLWVESRGPRIAMQSTLIHELTHAWQHHNKEFNQRFQRVLRKFPRRERARIRLLLLEGHAVYMEIDAMRRMHEHDYAERMHGISMKRNDEYGEGYRTLRGYIDSLAQQGSHMTPFNAMTQLMQDILDGKVQI